MFIRNRSLLSSMTGLALLSLTVPALANNTSEHKSSVHFELYRDYLIVVNGAAGPLKGLHFVLDTGASPTILDSRLANNLHLEETPASISAVNGSVRATQTVLPNLEFGPLHKENLPVLIADLSFFQSATSVPIDGVIGLDVLGQSPFEIDYVAQKIHFGDLGSLAALLPVHLLAGLPIVEGEFNHSPVRLLMDTGASSVILFKPPTPRRLGPVRVSMQQLSSRDIGKFGHEQMWLRSTKLGNAEFGARLAYVVVDRERPQDFEGILSPVALGITRLSFDLNRGVVSFSRDRGR